VEITDLSGDAVSARIDSIILCRGEEQDSKTVSPWLLWLCKVVLTDLTSIPLFEPLRRARLEDSCPMAMVGL
jgi:hypothetical protein